MNKLGWFGVRGVAPQALMDLAREISERAPPKDCPDEVLVRATTLGSALNLDGWEFGAVDKWAQATSLLANEAAVAFYVFEGLWDYWIFEAGEHVAGMDSRRARRTYLHGNVAHAASLFGENQETLEKYCTTWPLHGETRTGGSSEGETSERSSGHSHHLLRAEQCDGYGVGCPTLCRREPLRLSLGPRRRALLTSGLTWVEVTNARIHDTETAFPDERDLRHGPP